MQLHNGAATLSGTRLHYRTTLTLSRCATGQLHRYPVVQLDSSSATRLRNESRCVTGWHFQLGCVSGCPVVQPGIRLDNRMPVAQPDKLSIGTEHIHYQAWSHCPNLCMATGCIHCTINYNGTGSDSVSI